MRHHGCPVVGILGRVVFYCDRKQFGTGEKYYY